MPPCLVHWDADTRSDATWSLVDDARSDASWYPVAWRGVTDDDYHSEASSWDVLSIPDARPALEQRHAGDFAEEADEVSASAPAGCGEAIAPEADVARAGVPAERGEDIAPNAFLELICRGRWDLALESLESARDPLALAMARDGDGDSPLAWAAYKARAGNVSCIMLVCRLLALAPSRAGARGKNKFLPLHEAAWGNAPHSIAILLAAALPSALQDTGPGQTPHEVGHYYHSRREFRRLGGRRAGSVVTRPFAWPDAAAILRSAAELQACGSWRRILAEMRLPPVADLLSSPSLRQELEKSLGLPRPLAALVDDFVFSRKPAIAGLPAILEAGSCYPTSVNSANHVAGSRVRHRHHVRRSRPSLPEEFAGCHESELGPRSETEGVLNVEIEIDRELAAKDARRCSGVSRVRNTRCSCTESMIVKDDAGVLHHLAFHAAFTLPRSFQRCAGEPKWPTKMGWRRLRAADRAAKVMNLGR